MPRLERARCGSRGARLAHWALLPALTLVACEPVNRPSMNPGQDCMACHIPAPHLVPGYPGGAAQLTWTAAGTVFATPDAGVSDGVENVRVVLEDWLGKTVTLTTNAAGNFYTAEPLDLRCGLGVQIQYRGQCSQMITRPTPEMAYPDAVPVGAVNAIGCNRCHTNTYEDDGGIAPGGVIPGYQGLPIPGRISIPQGVANSFGPFDPCNLQGQPLQPPCN